MSLSMTSTFEAEAKRFNGRPGLADRSTGTLQVWKKSCRRALNGGAWKRANLMHTAPNGFPRLVQDRSVFGRGDEVFGGWRDLDIIRDEPR